MKKKLLSLVLVLTILLCELPVTALAAADIKCPNCGNYAFHPERGTEPTCTEGGILIYYCDACAYSETRTPAALGHSWGGWKTIKEPTCTEKGTRQHTCTRCGVTKTGSIDAKGHSYGSWTVVTEATCTEEGSKTAKCKVCGKKSTRTIEKLPHSWGEWEIVKEPTDFSMGTRGHTCGDCGTQESEDFYPDGTLKNGDRGNEVKALQEALNDNGYDSGKADGIFGGKTEDAVSAFETALGVEPDGIAWPGVVRELGTGLDDTLPDVTVLLAIDKEVPDNGFYFKEGEPYNYRITVTNNGKDFENGSVLLNIDEDVSWVDSVSLKNGQSMGFEWPYAPDRDDTIRGSINAMAEVQTYDGEETENEVSYFSNLVTVDTWGVDPDLIGLSITKTVDNTPADGEYFREGEVISFKIVAIIPFEAENIVITDSLAGEDEDPVYTLEKSDEEGVMITGYYEYTVTPGDIETGIVTNTAILSFEQGGAAAALMSDEVEVLLDPVLSAVDIYMDAVSDPDNGSFYVEDEEVRYDIYMVNNSDRPIFDVDIYGGENEFLANVPMLGCGESTPHYSYSSYVDKNGAEAGYYTDTATAYYSEGGGFATYSVRALALPEFEMTADEDTMISTIEVVDAGIEEPKKEGELILTKSVLAYPDKGYYAEGEQADFEITIENKTGETLYDVVIYDPLYSGTENLATFEELAPGAVETVHFLYTVTWLDANVKHVIINEAFAMAYDNKGHRHPASSNQVEIYCDTPEPIDDFVIIKEETSTPGTYPNGTYYKEGELIEYKITCINGTANTIINLYVYDNMDGSLIGEFTELLPGEWCECWFTWEVTAQDVEDEIVYNSATGYYIDNIGNADQKTSNIVESPTGKEDPVPEPTPVPKASKGDLCTRTILVRSGDDLTYEIHNCEIHAATRDMIELMVEAADTEEAKLKAWEYAVDLWLADIDTLYASQIRTLKGEAKSAMIAERTTFLLMLESYEGELNVLYPDDPVTVKKTLAELLMQRVTDLCYESSAAPGERLDRLLRVEESEATGTAEACACTEAKLENGNRLRDYDLCASHAAALSMMNCLLETGEPAATWDKIAALWQIELNKMHNLLSANADSKGVAAVKVNAGVTQAWIAARKTLLKELYPDNSEIVNEVIAEEIMALVTANCGR